MRSRAHFKSHPLHPILVAFPIAFLYGCGLADLVGRLFDWPRMWSVGAYLAVAAVVSGVIAGVPGFVDFLFVVPPASSAKKRALWHMLVNVSALALVAIGWLFRDWDSLAPAWPAILLELAGAGLVTWGGWLGGTLVHRNQIGVDHRYAHAGKWQEQAVTDAPGQTVRIDGADSMKPGQMRLLRWKLVSNPDAGRDAGADAGVSPPGETRLVLARTDDGYAGFDDRCTHRGGSLCDGALVDGIVQCPWHGSQFDVRSGQVKAGPAERPIGTCRAELHEGQVRLTLPADRPAP